MCRQGTAVQVIPAFLMNCFYEQNVLKTSLKCVCFSRAVLDGCLGAGSQLLQSLQADTQRRERRRHQHVFRVLPYPPPAAVYCTHWCRAATVSTTLTQLQTLESISRIIVLHLTFISCCCYWMIYVSCNHTPSCCARQFTHRTVGFLPNTFMLSYLCSQKIPDGRSKIYSLRLWLSI